MRCNFRNIQLAYDCVPTFRERVALEKTGAERFERLQAVLRGDPSRQNAIHYMILFGEPAAASLYPWVSPTRLPPPSYKSIFPEAEDHAQLEKDVRLLQAAKPTA